MAGRFSISKWAIRIVGGFGIWLLAIAFGLIVLRGNVSGFGTSQWWYETGTVYLLWGALNYIIFFGLVYFIIPQGLTSKNYTKMALLTLALILAVGLLKYYFVTRPRFEYVFVSTYKDGNENLPVYYSFRQYMQKTAFTGLFVSVIAYAFGLTMNWFNSEKLRKELEGKQLDAELSFLRMQLNPHFLFNSLNSIYSLSLKKSDAVPEAVLKLSEMMRYMLYESEDEDRKVYLDNEITYLTNYIGLQKIRFSDNIFVDFHVTGSTAGKKIAPLLLIPLTENGFKHGVLNDRNHPLQILLVIEGDKLIFNVKNKKNLDNKDFTGGVGMENVKRRLALLYPGKHQLTISDAEETYKAELVLFL